MSLEHALAELGQQINLEIPPSRVTQGIQLRLDSQARIGIAEHEGSVRVHVSHPVAAYEAAQLLLSAMKQAAAHADKTMLQQGWLEQDGQDWLVQAMQIPLEQVSALRLRQAIDALMANFEQLQST